MDLIHRVALEHVILSDQPFGAFGKKHLVAELDRCAHLAALDQVGMRFEDRIDLLSRGHLFAIKHAAAGLVDHPRPETAIMGNLIAQQSTLKEQLVGTWTIASWEDIGANGTKRQIANPKGFRIFDSGGRYA